MRFFVVHVLKVSYIMMYRYIMRCVVVHDIKVRFFVVYIFEMSYLMVYVCKVNCFMMRSL